MKRRLEKTDMGFSTCFFGLFKLHFVEDIIQNISYFMWFKKAEKLTQNKLIQEIYEPPFGIK